MRLTAKARRALPKNDYALPKKAPESGSYPIPNLSHARSALSFVSRYGTPEEKATVRRKAHAKFPEIKSPAHKK